MKGNRLKTANESLPVTEMQRLTNGTYQFRYDFSLREEAEGQPASFDYKYVNVKHNTRSQIILAIVRERYSQDEAEAILRKKQAGEDIIEFVKFNNFVNYAKAAADGNDLAPFKTKQVYEIIIPLPLTLAGGDYAALADKSIKLNIPYESDAIAGVAKAYPSWLEEADKQAIQADPRVTVNMIDLFE